MTRPEVETCNRSRLTLIRDQHDEIQSNSIPREKFSNNILILRFVTKVESNDYIKDRKDHCSSMN